MNASRLHLLRRVSHKLRIMLHEQRHPFTSLLAAENRRFALLGLDVAAAEVRLNQTLQSLGRKPFNRLDDSVHWLLFAAIYEMLSHTRILEIGTFDGSFSAILSELIPDSSITTIDLPDDDPIMRSSYHRENDEDFRNYQARLKRNLASPRITALKVNSLFLLDHVQGQFDLIWVDGGHSYPDVAWDMSNAWHLCRPGGYVLCDDILLDTSIRNDYVSGDSAQVIDYLAQRAHIQPMYFLKRLSPNWNAFPHRRKHVAMLAKPLN